MESKTESFITVVGVKFENGTDSFLILKLRAGKGSLVSTGLLYEKVICVRG